MTAHTYPFTQIFHPNNMPQKLQIEEMNRLDVAAFKAAEKLPLIVVLDNVPSLHNLASNYRTDDA